MAVKSAVYDYSLYTPDYYLKGFLAGGVCCSRPGPFLEGLVADAPPRIGDRAIGAVDDADNI